MLCVVRCRRGYTIVKRVDGERLKNNRRRSNAVCIDVPANTPTKLQNPASACMLALQGLHDSLDGKRGWKDDLLH